MKQSWRGAPEFFTEEKSGCNGTQLPRE